MLIKYDKYHALRNDFIVIDLGQSRLTKRKLPGFTRRICDRRAGVGADGVLCLSKSRPTDGKIDVFNADGSWAEKSGNGLRIAGVHVHMKSGRRAAREYRFQTATSIDRVAIGRKTKRGFMVTVDLGQPVFETSRVPVKSRRRYMINAPLSIGGVKLPVTCLSVGNPHTVLIVDDFDFDWHTLGAEIENHRSFPNRTNVEFVKIVSARKVELADWERGAGATGSSGTGAAAAVCAGVIMGLVDRRCQVVFESGSLHVKWPERSDNIELTGPVQKVTGGNFEV